MQKDNHNNWTTQAGFDCVIESRERFYYHKSVIGIVVFLLTGLLLTACQKAPSETGEKKEYTVFSYLAAESEERLITGLAGDRLYYVQTGSAGYALYASDMESLARQKIYEESDDEERPYVVMLAASSDDRTALLKYKGDRTNQTGNKTGSVMILEPAGEVQAEYDVTEYLEGERPKAMVLDSAGIVYFMLGGEEIRILAIDADGKLQCTFTPEGEDISQYADHSLFTDGEGHVYYACSSMGAAGSKVSLMELSLSKKTANDVCTLTVERASDVCLAGNRGEILFSQGEILYRLDPEDGEKQELLRWMDVDIDYGEIREIFLRENGDIGIYRTYADPDTARWCYEITLLRDKEKGGFPEVSGGGNQADASDGNAGDVGQAGESNGSSEGQGQEDTADGGSERTEEQVILTYATMQLDNQMRSLIVDFNKEHTECRIEVKEYGGGGTEAGLLRLNADIAAGNGPDIIDLDQIDVGPYVAKGILADLYPLLDADGEMSREDFVPGILRQYEEGGKLYGIMAGYRLETLMGKEAVVGDPSQWTLERMREALAQVPEDGYFIDNMAPMGLLRVLLHMGMGDYLNWEEGTCSFDGEDFLRLLELAGSMEVRVMDDDMEEDLASGKVLINRIYVSDISEYISSMEMFRGEKVSCVGYPSAQGGSALVTPFLPLGISDGNGHQDMAWSFVRTLLTEEFQSREIHFNLPIRLSVLEEKIDREAELSADSERPLTEEDKDAIYRMVDVPYGKTTFDRNVWSIISEEAESYFNGQKNVEEVAKIIQNRVEIYVSENY